MTGRFRILVCLQIIALSAIVSSCKESEGSGFEYEIKIEDIKPTKIHFNDLIEDYYYVRLETRKSALLGDIQQVLFLDSDIIVLAGNTIHCFDSLGGYKYSIDKQGRGPGEYLQIMNISISGMELFVCTTNGRINIYDSENGQYIETLDLGYYAAYCVVTDSHIYSDRKFFRIGDLNTDARLIIKSRDSDGFGKGYFEGEQYEKYTEGQFIGYNGSVYFSDPINNEVYKFLDGNPVKYILFDFGRQGLGESEKRDIIQGRIALGSVARFVSHVSDVFETEDFITASFLWGNGKYLILYDKRTRGRLLWEMYYPGEREAHQIFPYKVVGVYRDHFCCIIDPQILGQFRGNIQAVGGELPPTHPEYSRYSVLTQVSQEDNPILAFYKFRGLVR